MQESYDNFIKSLLTPAQSRSPQELSCIREHFKSFEEIVTYKDLTISEFARIARLERHHAHSTLYSQGSKCTSWYILLSGCVLVGQSMFLPRKSFGHQSNGSLYRFDECVILEDSDLIVFDYSANRQTGSISRKNSNVCCAIKEVDPQIPQGHSPHCGSNSKRSSDSSSVLSGFEVMSDYTKGYSPFSNTSCYESEDEYDDTIDTDSLSQDVYSNNDNFYDVISKNPNQWSETDIDVILDGVHNMSAFINFTSKAKRELCRVMRVKTVTNAEEKVMDDGHIHDTWTVILDGTVEVRYSDGSVREFSRGDCFGVRPNNEEQKQIGDMWTVTPSCLFFSVPKKEFCEIVSRNLDSIIPETEDNGRVVLVYEERNKSRVVVKGTVEKLIHCLILDQTQTDPMFVENFLITYRIFIKSPRILAEKLYRIYAMERTGTDTIVKATIRKCLLLWANNHFADFDDPKADMEEYLEKFDKLLSDGEYSAKDRSLYFIACSNNSKPRYLKVNIDKNYLKKAPFRLTGLQHGHGLFVNEIKRVNIKSQCGLRRGDQILSLSNTSWEMLGSLDKVYESLHSYATCSINMVVKFNPSGFQDALDDLSQTESQIDHDSSNVGLTIAFDMLYASKRHSIVQESTKPIRRSFLRSGSVSLHGMGIHPKGGLITPMPVPQPMEFIPSSPPPKPKSSARSANTSPNRQIIRQKSVTKCDPVTERRHNENSKHQKLKNCKSSSNPDLKQHEASLISDANNNVFISYQVIKVFRPNSSDSKLVLVTNQTTAKDALSLVMKEFSIDVSEMNEYALCLVTIDSGDPVPIVKSSRVAMHLRDLASRLSLNQRYYLRHNQSDSQLISEDQAKSVLSDAKVTLGQLSAFEIATRLTLIDYALFRDIQSAEYINFIMKLPLLEEEDKLPNSVLDFSKLEQSNHNTDGFSTGCENYIKFEEIINRESFWPTSEICLETNVNKRSELIKKFIEVANICKDLKNFNSLMCIITGLTLTPVSRLKASWDKVPKKYIKKYEELSFLTDMSCNFRQIRRLVSSEEPPIIPYLAIHSKDLATIHMGNKTCTKDGLINFEKLRMMASEIRKLTRMASACYNLQAIISSTKSRSPHGFFAYNGPITTPSLDETDSTRGISGSENHADHVSKKTRSNSVDQFAFKNTLKKKTNKRKSINVTESQYKNPKKIYEEWFSTLKVRTYLSNLNVEMNINRLQEMSYTLETPTFVTSGSNNTISLVSSVESLATDQTANVKVTTPKPQVHISSPASKLRQVSPSIKVPPTPHSHPLPTRDPIVPVLQEFRGRPKSIFSFQNQEDVDKLMELVEVTKKVSKRRQTIKSSEDDGMSKDCSVTVDQTFLRNLPMYNNNRQLIQELRASQSRQQFRPSNNNDLQLQPQSESLPKKTPSDSHYCYPLAGAPVNNCYHGVTNCQPILVPKDSISPKPIVLTKTSPQLPSYNQHITQVNHHEKSVPIRLAPPKPPPRTVTITRSNLAIPATTQSLKHQNE